MYSFDQSGKSLVEISAEVEKAPGLTESGRGFAGELIVTVVTNLKQIDEMIKECSINWELSRILPTDMNIMRIAVGELINRTPPGVAINEAIEISKRFGTANSGHFVNGILDCVRKKLQSQDG